MANVKITDLPEDTTLDDASALELASNSSGTYTSKRALLSTLAAYIVGKVNAALTASPLTIARGGTGAGSAVGARSALGLAIGTNVQAFDAATLIGQSAAPTLTVGSGAGTGATVSQTFSKGGGTITINTGSDASSGALVTATYASAFPNRSHTVMSAANAASAPTLSRNGYVTTTAAGFTVSSTAISPSSTIVLHYLTQGS